MPSKKKASGAGVADVADVTLSETETNGSSKKRKVDAADADMELDAAELNGAAERESGKGGDKPGGKENNDGNAGAGEGGDATDTEYDELDLSTCPQEIYISESGHPKIDGQYKRLDRPSRGRPCYCMHREGKKSLYLFWYKNGKWHVSYELGSHRNLARVEDSKVNGRRQPPCEPHPFSWKVLAHEHEKDKGKEGKSKVFNVSAPMRVIDASSPEAEADAEADELLLGHEPWVGKEVVKKPKRPPAPTPSDDAVAVSSGPPNTNGTIFGAPAPPIMTPDGNVLDEEAVAAEAAAGMAGSDSDDEDRQDPAEEEKDSSSEEDSDSEGSSSSSSAGDRPPPVAEAAAPPRADAAAATPEAAAGGAFPRREAFAQKLRIQLQAIQDPQHRQFKLQQVRAMLSKDDRRQQLEKQTGLTTSEIQLLLDRLESAFCPKPAPVPATAAKPSSKPPAANGGGAAAPTTPPVQEANMKSSLRRKGPHRFGARGLPRITWPTGIPANTVIVQSHRHMGELLWYQMPGAYVFCDSCGNQVSQSMGALHGEPNKPQFAQNQFFCRDCLEAHQVANTMADGFGA